MRDFALRSHIKAAFDAAIGLLPASGPLAGFRAELANLRDDYPKSRPRWQSSAGVGSGSRPWRTRCWAPTCCPRRGRAPDVPAESRANLHDQLGRHGIEVACRLLAGGADEAALRQGLADHSGLTAFTDLLRSQLAERADLVRARTVIAKASALAARLRDDQDADLTGSEYATLDSVVGLFRNQATSAWDRHTVVSDCRSGRLSLDESDLAHALRHLGEPGQSARDRLGATAATPAAEVADRARAEWEHWARLDGIPFNGDTRRACRMVLRACEELVAQTSQG
jgi:hypothetical protein